MPVAAGVYVVRDAKVTIEGVDYANQCTVARLVPDVPIQTQRTLVPDGTITDVDSAAWTFEVTAVQKNNTGGLAKVLRGMAPGEELEVVLTPKDATGEDVATFTIRSLPVPFGGEQGSFPTFEAVFPVLGSPVFSSVPA